MKKVFIRAIIYLVGISIIFMLLIILRSLLIRKNYKNKFITLNSKRKFLNNQHINSFLKFIYNNFIFSYGNIYIPPIVTLIFSILISFFSYVFSYKMLNIISSSVIISICTFFIPSFFIEYVTKYNKNKILISFPTYLATLKNYTKTENDIVVALNRATPCKETKDYILKFNNEIQNGVKIYDAFENLKSSINISKISEFFTAVEYCYINGGNFVNIIDKYLSSLVKLNMQKEKEEEKRLEIKLVILFLIAVNLYMLFGFIYANPTYKEIILNNLVGKIIVNINIISYVIIFLIFRNTNKEE